MRNLDNVKYDSQLSKNPVTPQVLLALSLFAFTACVTGSVIYSVVSAEISG